MNKYEELLQQEIDKATKSLNRRDAVFYSKETKARVSARREAFIDCLEMYETFLECTNELSDVGGFKMSVTKAVQELAAELQMSKGYSGDTYDVWQSNLACIIMDYTNASPAEANKAAEVFLDRLCGKGDGDI